MDNLIILYSISVIFLSFADTAHWLKYFPPIAEADLKSMGLKVGVYCKIIGNINKNNIVY